MKKYLLLVLVALLGVCNVSAKKTWKKGSAEWAKIQIQTSIDYDNAFLSVLEYVSNDFEMDMINKEGGYLRTAWNNTKNAKGKLEKNMRMRVTIKFNHDRSQIQVKTEVQKAKGDDEWVDGEDSAKSQKVKEDLRGIIGF